MLCYQYGRSASDVLHDTFSWLMFNRRIFAAIAVPVLIACMASVAILGFGTRHPDLGTYHNEIDYFLAQLIPLRLGGFAEKPENLRIAICLMTFVVSMLMVPLMRQYFVNRKSIRLVTLSRTASLLPQNLGAALTASFFQVIVYYITLSGEFWLVLIGIIVYIIYMPCLIMGVRPRPVPATQLIKITFTTFCILLVYCILQASPILCLDILDLFLYMCDKIMPGSVLTWHDFGLVINTFILFCTCMAFCVSVIVLMVSSLLLHGSYYTSPETYES